MRCCHSFILVNHLLVLRNDIYLKVLGSIYLNRETETHSPKIDNFSPK